MLLTPDDLAQLAARGVTREQAEWQLDTLRNPPPAIVLDRPCTIGDGITRLDVRRQDELSAIGADLVRRGGVTKFVPASGAATRMFKDLIAALNTARPSESPAAREFFTRLDEFPFSAELRQRASIAASPRSADEERRLLQTLLFDMGYARLPKALIPFHRVGRPRTAFEEQLLEGARYTCGDDRRARMHFTVAPEFATAFQQALASSAPRVSEARGGCALDVTFSEQDPATDTLAVDANGEPFRLADGTLLFRPGGHGALISNLNALAASIVVIKNVDNILPDERTAEVVRWKLILIGLLATLQAEGTTDRPIRVCGVVKNEGEPGGAPFWVTDPQNGQSIQIVESSQVAPRQQPIFQTSTHFNPVDIVCALRGRDGRQFDLHQFVDQRAVFIADKSHDGRALKALERPGLWNGAMAGWRTVCVEVPASTFAPVKTVFDLLRPQHQS
jgi:hypothetical protein